jgi:hypothetical protein
VSEVNDPTSPPPPRVTIALRFGRAVSGFCLGWAWASFVALAWLGAMAVWYGSLDRGLAEVRDEPWAPIAVCAFFASYAGTWVGSTVGPFCLGPTRRRRPVLLSSLGGAIGGAFLAAIFGASAGLGWLVLVASPPTPRAVLLFMSHGGVLGVVAGWLAGWCLSRT